MTKESILKQLNYYFAQVKYLDAKLGNTNEVTTIGLCIGTCGKAKVILVYVNPTFKPRHWELCYEEDSNEDFQDAVSYAVQTDSLDKGFHILYKASEHSEIVTNPLVRLNSLEDGGHQPRHTDKTIGFYYEGTQLCYEIDLHHPAIVGMNSILFSDKGVCIGFMDNTYHTLTRLKKDGINALVKELKKYEKLKEVDAHIKNASFMTNRENGLYHPFLTYLETESLNITALEINSIFDDYPNEAIKSLKYSLACHNRNKLFSTLNKIIKWHQREAVNAQSDAEKMLPLYSLHIFWALLEDLNSKRQIDIDTNPSIRLIMETLKQKYPISFTSNTLVEDSFFNVVSSDSKLDLLTAHICDKIYGEYNDTQTAFNKFFAIKNNTTLDDTIKMTGKNIIYGKYTFNAEENCFNTFNLASIFSTYWLVERKSQEINLGNWFS
jgi:hypothetical protein